MPQRVLVTGGSGFVGSAVLRELLTRGHGVHAIVNRGGLKISDDRIRIIRANLFSPADLDAAMAGCDAAIHLVGIIREKRSAGATFERLHDEATRNIVDAARRAGIRRYVHMSAQGARGDAPSRYHRTKFRGEEHVRSSGLDWTIFRPSLIHGPGGEFTQMEAAWARGAAMPFIAMPYFGRGILGLGTPAEIQPVFVEEVARAFADALEKPQTIGGVYAIGGSEVLTWPQMHRAAAQIITGKSRLTLPIPAWYASMLARLVPGRLLPFNRDQVLMAGEDNTADLAPFIRDFGWQPGSFSHTLRGYASQL